MTEDLYGFKWGQVTVERLASIQRSNGTYRIVRVNDIEVYVSPTGRTRVFRKGFGELKAVKP